MSIYEKLVTGAAFMASMCGLLGGLAALEAQRYAPAGWMISMAVAWWLFRVERVKNQNLRGNLAVLMRSDADLAQRMCDAADRLGIGEAK